MLKAWVENKVIRDICHGEPSELYHPDVAALYTEEVPDNAENGDGWDGVTLTKPVIVAAEPPTPFEPVINFTYPPAAAKATDITVDVAVVNSADNSPVPVTETYYVPLMNIITGVMEQMLVIPVVDGVGQVVFSVATAGVVGINVELIRPKPTAVFSALPDIAIY